MTPAGINRAVLGDTSGGLPAAERRQSPRVPLRCQLSILADRTAPRRLLTVTENLNSRGFYCVVDEPLAAGDQLVCILRLPNRAHCQSCQALRCAVEVVWVQQVGDGRFGIGCRIDDYSLAG